MAAPLPKVDSTDVQCATGGDPEHLSAYVICLKYEEELAAFKDRLRHVRIVGYLLLHSPSRGVRSEIIRYILSHEDMNDIVELGKSFEHDVIRLMARSANEPKMDWIGDIDIDDITQAPKSRRQAKYRALKRDGWGCVVTGIESGVTPHDSEKVGVYTYCCYIVPVALLSKTTEDDRFPSPIAVLRREIRTIIGENVHSLKNVFSLDIGDNMVFDMLLMFFEATAQQDTYRVVYLKPRMRLRSAREYVTFSTSDPMNLPVPAPELLAFHAACCKVALLSGVNDYIDSLLGDLIK